MGGHKVDFGLPAGAIFIVFQIEEELLCEAQSFK
jgi:hypothetical protein